jgi:SNF family Na+-dependent transporter
VQDVEALVVGRSECKLASEAMPVSFSSVELEASPTPAARVRRDVPSGEPETREKWNSRYEFLLSTIGMAVGVGNVWRFPYLCYKYGGGTFLLPYMVALFLLGIPLFLLELAVGQKFQKGTYHALTAIHPALGGFGLASFILSWIVSNYYAVLIAWSAFYFAKSFHSKLPWASDSESYWYEDVLQKSSGFEETGGIPSGLLGSLVFCWVFTFVGMYQGIQSAGKVVWVTATLPYVMLVILFFRGITLEGASEGIEFYLKPDFSALGDPHVWTIACQQIFYSLGVGWGSLITYGSYNPQSEDIVWASMFVPLVNSGTSIFAGLPSLSHTPPSPYLSHTHPPHLSISTPSTPPSIPLYRRPPAHQSRSLVPRHSHSPSSSPPQVSPSSLSLGTSHT